MQKRPLFWCSMTASFLQVIQDYTTPPQKELSRDLEATIKPYIRYTCIIRITDSQ